MSEALVRVGDRAYTAHFVKARKGWVIQTETGELYSKSANLACIGKVFGERRAAIVGAPEPVLPPALVIEDESVLRQVRRILESMKTFGFDRGGYWQKMRGDHFEKGWTPRVAGDPIYNTIGQVAGVECTRDEMIEAIAAVAEGRHPNLPPRMKALPAAIQVVAEALAAGKRMVMTEFGTEMIEGPMLPPNWDEAAVDSDDNIIEVSDDDNV